MVQVYGGWLQNMRVPMSAQCTELMAGNLYNDNLCRRSGLVISREQGLRYNAGFAVPVLMS